MFVSLRVFPWVARFFLLTVREKLDKNGLTRRLRWGAGWARVNREEEAMLTPAEAEAVHRAVALTRETAIVIAALVPMLEEQSRIMDRLAILSTDESVKPLNDVAKNPRVRLDRLE